MDVERCPRVAVFQSVAAMLEYSNTEFISFPVPLCLPRNNEVSFGRRLALSKDPTRASKMRGLKLWPTFRWVWEVLTTMLIHQIKWRTVY